MKVFVVMRLCVVGLIRIRTISIYIHSLELRTFLDLTTHVSHAYCVSRRKKTVTATGSLSWASSAT
jgi:hypothetical protein